MKGTLRFSQSLLDEEEEITINYNHYKMEVSSISPDSDMSPDRENTDNAKLAKSEKGAQKRIFYVSSEENSEAIDTSPSDPHGSGANNIHFKLPLQSDFELEDLKVSGNTRQSSAKRGKMFKTGGPDEIESEFSKSWSPDSTNTDISMESDLEESPNPLYRIRNSSYTT